MENRFCIFFHFPKIVVVKNDLRRNIDLINPRDPMRHASKAYGQFRKSRLARKRREKRKTIR